MRFHFILDSLFAKKTNIKVLRFFATRSKEASVREISREVGVSAPNVSISLSELHQESILSMKKIGRSHVYLLNLNNSFVINGILPLFKEEQAVFQRLREAVVPMIKFPYESLIIFGSLARGEESAQSDIDLAVIIDSKQKKKAILDELLSLSQIISRKFGNPLSPVIYFKKEFLERYKDNLPPVKEIYKNGKVLDGKSLNKILMQD